jgi:hypothetical protein
MSLLLEYRAWAAGILLCPLVSISLPCRAETKEKTRASSGKIASALYLPLLANPGASSYQEHEWEVVSF